MKGKRILVLMLICMVALCCGGCKSDEEKAARQAQANWNQADNAQQMSIYCALIKEYMLLTEDLGENTPYPAMKRTVKGSMMSSGLTQEEAIDQAEEYLIREQAVFWQAAQDGMQATDDKVKAYIQENIINQVAKDENYAAVSKACEQEGITFEDTIWAYESSYKVDYIGELAGFENYEEMDAYQTEAVRNFQASEEYGQYKTVLDTCAQLIRDNVTDKDALKKAEIYYE